jgi:hypothetical protein
LGKRIQAYFKKADSEPVSAPSHIRASVIQALEREAQAGERKGRSGLKWMMPAWLKWVALPAAAASLTVATWSVLRGPNTATLSASVGRPAGLRMDLSDVRKLPIESVRIEIPSGSSGAGVSFYSEKFPELANDKQIKLTWDPALAEGGELPIAVQGSEPGHRALEVTFIGSDGKPLAERRIELEFR